MSDKKLTKITIRDIENRAKEAQELGPWSGGPSYHQLSADVLALVAGLKKATKEIAETPNWEAGIKEALKAKFEADSKLEDAEQQILILQGAIRGVLAWYNADHENSALNATIQRMFDAAIDDCQAALGLKKKKGKKQHSIFDDFQISDVTMSLEVWVNMHAACPCPMKQHRCESSYFLVCEHCNQMYLWKEGE